MKGAVRVAEQRKKGGSHTAALNEPLGSSPGCFPGEPSHVIGPARIWAFGQPLAATLRPVPGTLCARRSPVFAWVVAGR